MRGKSLLAFAMAIGCGLVAMVGVQQVLRKQTGNQDADKVTVFVAATEILPGQMLDLSMLERRKFLKGSVPKEAVIDPKQIEKRALTCKVMPGDIIRIDKLGSEGKTGASISIPPGMRVMSLPTNTTQAHSGMIQPGDRVDVMVSYQVRPPQGGGRDYPETKTILGFIQVFATDAVRDTNSTGEGAKGTMKNVSLLVTPEQAQVLMMAQSVGTLHLSLRNASDNKEVEIANLTPDQFRDSVVMQGVQTDEPDPSKQEGQPRKEASEPANNLDDFLKEVAGNAGAPQAPAANSNTEPWQIAFYGKDGVKIETVEIPRRPVAPPAVATDTANQSASSSVIGSLLNMLQPSKNKNSETAPPNAQDSESAQVTDPKTVEAKPTATTRRFGKSKPGAKANKTTQTSKTTAKTSTSPKKTSPTKVSPTTTSQASPTKTTSQSRKPETTARPAPSTAAAS